MENYLGENTGKLGFGLMRLPKIKRGMIDIEQVKEMVDLFIAAGFTYFDTAYVYDNGGSEKAAKEALVDRYPRESFTLATKLNAMIALSEKIAKQQFYTSLERSGAGYFDYYLLHSIIDINSRKYENFHLWDFVGELKEQGLIKHWGFSFHGTPELLERVLREHPDAEFVQLQINYADWESRSVASRLCYETARRHGKPVVVMEPVKGGSLANPPAKVQDILKTTNPNASFASWAIRYAASLDGIITVLSGMSNLEQMRDNLSFMKDFKKLDPGEQLALSKAREVFNSVKSIPCTGCRYCVGGCPKKIAIPEIFAARNKQLVWGQLEESKKEYLEETEGVGKASDCIACGQCISACPQHLEIVKLLSECAKTFEQ